MRHICVYADNAVVHTLLAHTRLTAPQMLHLQHGITNGRRTAAFQGHVNGVPRLPRACVRGRRCSRRILKARSSAGGAHFLDHVIARIRCIHPTDAMGKSWSFRKTKNDHEASGSWSGKKPRVGRYASSSRIASWRKTGWCHGRTLTFLEEAGTSTPGACRSPSATRGPRAP
jgi:hypothetical protein